MDQSQVRTDVGGEQKTQNYDVSSLIGDGVSVTSVTSSPLVSAMMISIVLNLVNFSILYYQVRLRDNSLLDIHAKTYFREGTLHQNESTKGMRVILILILSSGT